eukprot:TRINITY_DN31014_c0_g1_i1.p1 TRINITY_DN31014_c0_g1~~TRINITY_DN31014_c0_g1_i1.p1  ORF type:complete len:188 (+),score=66.25 TRINITY_DN31014_c0_g1_i1:88-651(+)
MNYKLHELPKMNIEELQARDTLNCLLHSVLFHRQLGAVFPQEENLMDELGINLSFTKVGSDDSETHKRVKKGVDGFCSTLQKVKYDQKINKCFSVTLRLLHNTGAHSTEWERWVIPLQLQSMGSKSDLQATLLKSLNYISKSTDTAILEGYVPVNDGSHFEFQILHDVGGTTIMETVGNLLSYLTYR